MLDLDLLYRLGAAALAGLLLGLDRELSGHDAGLRTHGMVSLSAATLTISILALGSQIGGTQSDVLRLYEAVAGFAGILSAALIVFSRNRLRNLTSAAHLWLASVIGIACGAAQWPLVLSAGAIALVLLSVVHVFERWLPRRRSNLANDPRD